MTAQFLTNELTNLVQEAKRKNSDLRHVCTSFQKQQEELTVWIGGCQAAEKSLSDLKSLGPLTEVAAGLSAFIYSPVCQNPRTRELMAFSRAILKTRLFVTVPDSLRNPKRKV